MPSKDIGFEVVNTDWFDPDAIRLPDYRVGRVNYGYGRSYIRIKDGELEDPFRLYTSLTTAISSCAPMERGLLEWYCRLGIEEADRYTAMKSHYGTLMHILFGRFLAEGFFDFKNTELEVARYVEEKKLQYPECTSWPGELQYDIAAFAAFCSEYKVKPIGIEYVLLSERGYGTLIDLVCKLHIPVKGHHGEVYKSGPRKGEPKETIEYLPRTAIINFKSGRHAFWRSNGIQTICEKQLFEENFPDIKLDCAFNWSPKDWRTYPDWNLKDWTGEISNKEIEAVLTLADERFGSKAMERKYLTVGGTAYMGRPIDECITTIGVHEYCKQVYSDYL